MTRTVYRTATSITGHITDEDHSLDWLFAVDHKDADDHEAFMADVGVMVEGSSTYEWVLRETNMLAEPQKWQQFYGSRPTFVFTSRSLPTPEGANVRFLHGRVADNLQTITAAAEDKNVWVVGGGDLAGQFLDAGALDEIVLTIAPVALTGGAPLLPRRVESDRLSLRSVDQRGQFVHVVYAVDCQDRGPDEGHR